jgi:tetratricopeptide (TPR) repeat protein
VEKQRKKWIMIAVMGFMAVGFISFTMVPLISGLTGNRSEPPAAASATPTPTAIATPDNAELQRFLDEEKGFQVILQKEPNNPTALKGLIEVRNRLVQLNARKLESLLEPLETLAKTNPTQPDYGILLAQTQYQTGQREQAVQTYRGVLASFPGYQKALQGLSALYIAEKQPNKALDLLNQTLAKAPGLNQVKPGSVDVPAVKLMLGDVYAEQQDYPAAIALYDELIKENGTDFRPVLGKALVLRTQGKMAEAEPLFNSAIALAPPQYKDQIKQTAQQPANLAPTNGQPPNGLPIPVPPAQSQ